MICIVFVFIILVLLLSLGYYHNLLFFAKLCLWKLGFVLSLDKFPTLV